MSRSAGRWRAVTAVALTVAAMATTTGPVGAAAVTTPVADGFVGPLGLAVGEDGSIYVAEAFSGQLTTIARTGRRSVLHSSAEGSVAGVAAVGRGNVVFTSSVFPEDPEAPALDTMLQRVTPAGRTSTLASLQDHEERVNPDGAQEYGFVDVSADCLAQLPPFVLPYTGIVESNPYAVAIDGGTHLVADAAGNSIVRVAADGRRVTTVAVLPPVPQHVDADLAAAFGLPDCVVGHDYLAEPVPTDVEVGPDGHYYVSSLPGGPELPGSASVFRVNRTTGAVTQVATGLTSAVDLAVAKDGTIYVAELFADRISTVRNGVVEPLVEVPTPGAVEIARDGTIYATTGVFGPNGAVVTITP